MPNPPFLICDSDALIQFFIAREFGPFRELKKSYCVQPAIVSEVELEICSTKKFGNRFDALLTKAISSGTIQVLDQTSLQSYLVSPVTHSGVANATWASIQSLGAQYRLHVGRGEAYTHAAAFILGLPAMSNDLSALITLRTNGFAVPSPVLRGFDLLVFSYQIAILTEAECDSFRKSLLQEREGIPAAFKAASFANGLKQFCPRLLDSSKPPVGAQHSSGPAYTQQLLLSRTISQ